MSTDESSISVAANVRSLAVVSGKGGSGKTMVAASIAHILDDGSQRVILMDADLGTAGLSYYLGIKQVESIRLGLSAFIMGNRPVNHGEVSTALRPVRGLLEVSLMPIGDHRRLSRALAYQRAEYEKGHGDALQFDVVRTIRLIVRQLEETLSRTGGGILIVDCRGGIDEESLAICEAVDDILLVIEPDTTSFEASRHLVETLTDLDLDHKVRGFFVNKVFSDPSVVARSGTSVFGAQFLGAIPFDPEATRAFLVGNIPLSQSTFLVELGKAVYKAYPETVPKSYSRGPAFDFASVGLEDAVSRRGGAFLATILSALGVSIILALIVFDSIALSRLTVAALVAILTIVGALTGLERARRAIGRAFFRYRESEHAES